MKKIKDEYLRDPEFEPSRVAKASSAAEGLCKWCMAMVKYDEIKKIVAPKEKALAEAEAELDILNKALNEKQTQLKMVVDRLALLQKNLDENTAKKESLEAEVCNETICLDIGGKTLSSLHRLRKSMDFIS